MSNDALINVLYLQWWLHQGSLSTCGMGLIIDESTPKTPFYYYSNIKKKKNNTISVPVEKYEYDCLVKDSSNILTSYLAEIGKIQCTSKH